MFQTTSRSAGSDLQENPLASALSGCFWASSRKGTAVSQWTTRVTPDNNETCFLSYLPAPCTPCLYNQHLIYRLFGISSYCTKIQMPDISSAQKKKIIKSQLCIMIFVRHRVLVMDLIIHNMMAQDPDWKGPYAIRQLLKHDGQLS